MILRGTNIALREVEEADTDWLVRLRSDPELNTFISEVSADEHRAWLGRRRGEGTDFYFVIETDAGERAGLIALYEIDRERRSAMYGRFVLEKRFRPLYAAEALLTLLDFGFGPLGLKTVYGEMQGENAKAISFARSFGFSLSEERPGAWFNKKLGRIQDVYRYTLSREAFEARRPALAASAALLQKKLAEGR